jgi:hypothetical protein
MQKLMRKKGLQMTKLREGQENTLDLADTYLMAERAQEIRRSGKRRRPSI